MERLVDGVRRNAGLLFMCLVGVIGLLALMSAGCTASEVQAETPQRFSMEKAASNYGENIKVFVIRDSEAGDEWLLVEDTSYGNTSIDVEPLEVGQ